MSFILSFIHYSLGTQNCSRDFKYIYYEEIHAADKASKTDKKHIKNIK